MATTRTATLAQTRTTTVVYVARKIQTDLLEILDTYGYFSETYAQRIMNDLRVFLGEEMVSSMHFTWTGWGSDRVIEEFEYRVFFGDIALADDRPGGIRYRADLQFAEFHVRIEMNERGRKEEVWMGIRDELQLQWTGASDLDYSWGTWTADRTYSRNGFAVSRHHFTS